MDQVLPALGLYYIYNNTKKICIKDDAIYFIKIEGIVEVRDDEDNDIFIDEFLEFIERHKWYFGGGSREVNESGEDL
ncbi:hypothetical protein J43TS9_53060 [Paenibacillus cineris]|nr:hypothetical protein J43TS9_53060 [Paenibacillus cineris]